MGDEPLDDAALLAWAREWERHLATGPVRGFHVPIPILRQLLAKAIERLALLAKRGANRRGRPRGGMGAEAAGLIADGVERLDAVRVIARKHGKPAKSVSAALGRYRRAQKVK